VPDQSVQWLKEFHEAEALNPALARQMLQQAMAQYPDESAAPAAAVEIPEFEPLTDGEEILYRDLVATKTELNAIKSELQEFREFKQQQDTASVQAKVEQQFDSVQAEAGVPIPREERDQMIRELIRRNLPYTEAANLWKATRGWDHALKRGREEGERIAAAKRQMSPSPSGIVHRDNGPPPVANTLEEHLARTLATE
jgi:hypothetical protein